jgi:hypothetical protein
VHCFGYSSVTTPLFPVIAGDGIGAWNMHTVRVPNADTDPSSAPNTLEDDTDSFGDYAAIALTCQNLKL